MLPFVLLALLVLPRPDRSELFAWPPVVEALLRLSEDPSIASDPPEARRLQRQQQQQQQARGKWLAFPFRASAADARLHYACSYLNPVGVSECAPGWNASESRPGPDRPPQGRKCYQYFPICLSYEVAQQQCRSNARVPANTVGNLASVGDPAENQVLTELAGERSFWIGLDIYRGVWEDGSEAGRGRYSNWLFREPPRDRRGRVSSEDLVMVNSWEHLGQACPCDMTCSGFGLRAGPGSRVGFDIMFVSLAFSAVLAACTLYYFRGHRARQHRRPLPPPEALAQTAFGMHGTKTWDSFAFPICPGCVDCDTCCLSVWALYARAGDTYATAGIGNFWTPALVFFSSVLLGTAIDWLVMFSSDYPYDTCCRMWLTSLIWSCYAGRQRWRLRKRMGSDPQVTEIGEDFCLWFWCPLCAAVQEARQTDAADGSYAMCWCCDLVEHHHPSATRLLLGVSSREIEIGQVHVGQPVGVIGADSVVLGRPTPQAPGQVLGNYSAADKGDSTPSPPGGVHL